jgi:hypothetical protein
VGVCWPTCQCRSVSAAQPRVRPGRCTWNVSEEAFMARTGEFPLHTPSNMGTTGCRAANRGCRSDDGGPPALRLGPAAAAAQQHIRPRARVGPSGTGCTPQNRYQPSRAGRVRRPKGRPGSRANRGGGGGGKTRALTLEEVGAGSPSGLLGRGPGGGGPLPLLDPARVCVQ